MAYDDEDLAGAYSPEPDPIAKAATAQMLVEQMRQEEEALSAASQAALPAQSSEAAAAREGWEALGRPAFTQPVQLAQGQVMPTRSGFMYVGSGIGSPAAGGPLAATRAYESALNRQNVPEANIAYQDLAGMGLRPPGAFIGGARDVPMPAPSGDEIKFAAMQRYQKAYSDALASGKTPDQSAAEAWGASGADLFARGGARRAASLTGPVTPYEATYGGKRFVVNPKTGTSHPINESTPAIVLTRIKGLEKTVADWNKRIADDPKNKQVGEWTKERDTAQAEWLRLYNQYAPTEARSVPAILPPATTATTTNAPMATVTSQAQFDALAPGTVYIGRDGKRYRKT